MSRLRALALELTGACLFFLSSGLLAQPGDATCQRSFVHAPNGDWSRAHSDTILNYIAWDGSKRTVSFERQMSRGAVINYLTWDGTRWAAKLEGAVFVHAPAGNWAQSHRDTIINYTSWDNAKWTARMSECLTASCQPFVHAPNGDWSRAHSDTILNYIAWDGSKRTVSFEREMSQGAAIDYLTWDGTKWTAKLEGAVFIHAPAGNWAQSHRDTIINYESWDGGRWTARIASCVPTGR